MSKVSQYFQSLDFDLIMRTVQAGILVYSNDGTIIYSNPTAYQLLGISEVNIQPDDEGACRWFRVDEHGVMGKESIHPAKLVLEGEEALSGSVFVVTCPKQKDLIWLRVDAAPTFEQQMLHRIVVTFANISTEVATIEKLKNTEDAYRRIFEKTPMGMCITDEKGYFESVNSAYLDLYGYTKEEMLGKHFTMVVPDDDKELLSDIHDKFMEEKTEIRGNWDVVNKYGEVKSILADAALVRGQDGRPKKVTFVMDITQEKKYERQLKSLATQDPLTLLFNRRYFFEQSRQEVGRATRYGTPFSLLLVDVDNFKGVNDTYGHMVGDKVLQHLAQLMKQTFRDLDVLCRYGGEEFIILMPNTQFSNAYLASERFRRVVENSLFEEGLQITISGGVREYDKSPLDDFISSVDTLLYSAKQQGKNRINGGE